MEKDAIAVFTARSPEGIVRAGGSQAWVLNAAHAKQCTWLVCVQNCHNPHHEYSDATQPHGTAFLVGKISEIIQVDDRWMIAISEFARVAVPDAWDHNRNPVRYTTLSELGINPDTLDFKPVPPNGPLTAPAQRVLPNAPTAAAALAEAKKTVAAAFGLRPESVEITIRA